MARPSPSSRLELSFVGATLFAFFAVAAPHAAGTPPPALLRPHLREVTCGSDIAIIDVQPQAREETVTLQSRDPIPIDLTAWRVHVGKRKHALDGIIEPLAAHVVVLSRLRNEGGEATLVDPCGIVVASLRWGDLEEEVASGAPR